MKNTSQLSFFEESKALRKFRRRRVRTAKAPESYVYLVLTKLVSETDETRNSFNIAAHRDLDPSTCPQGVKIFGAFKSKSLILTTLACLKRILIAIEGANSKMKVSTQLLRNKPQLPVEIELDDELRKLVLFYFLGRNSTLVAVLKERLRNSRLNVSKEISVPLGSEIEFLELKFQKLFSRHYKILKFIGEKPIPSFIFADQLDELTAKHSGFGSKTPISLKYKARKSTKIPIFQKARAT